MRKEIQNLILMLAGGLLAAFVLVVALLYFFGPSGTYLVRDVLVAPQALEKNAFDEKAFIFDKIEFVVADTQGKGWGRYAVSVESYAAFYKIVALRRSLPQIDDTIVRQFNTLTPSTLTIFVQSRGQEEALFQQVEFLDQDDLFRVELQGEWIYFRYPGVYKIALELFAPEMK